MIIDDKLNIDKAHIWAGPAASGIIVTDSVDIGAGIQLYASDTEHLAVKGALTTVLLNRQEVTCEECQTCYGGCALEDGCLSCVDACYTVCYSGLNKDWTVCSGCVKTYCGCVSSCNNCVACQSCPHQCAGGGGSSYSGG